MIKVMGLAHKDIKTANINTFKDLMGNINLMRKGIKDFFKIKFLEMKQCLKWKISLEGINNWLDTKKEKKKSLNLEA